MNPLASIDSSNNRSLADALAHRGIASPGAEISEHALELLTEYCQLLWTWNKRLNLTRHLDYDTFVCRDLVDSLQLSALLDERAEVMDMGAGGGAPGLVLAILRPDLRVALCESMGKKAEALQYFVDQLHVSAPVYHARAEEVLEDRQFNAVTARAVGPLWKVCKWLRPHWAAVGKLLAVKGPRWTQERKDARHRGMLAGLELRRAVVYRTPGTNAENVILQIHKP